MLTYFRFGLVFVLVASFCPLANSQQKLTRKDFMSDAGFIVGTYSPKSSSDKQPTQNAFQAASKLIDLLSERQKKSLMHELQGAERRKWTNTPARGNAGGLPLKAMNSKQVHAFCDLLASLSSKDGYKKITEIMLGDDLRSMEHGRPNPGVGIEAFRLVIFGKPDLKKPWGLQLDGHHIAFNISVEGDKLAMSPSFFGTRPDVFKVAGKQMEPLMQEVDLAYRLVNSLSLKQKRQAVLDDTRGRMRIGPGADGFLPEVIGLRASEMTKTQKELFTKLIAQWVHILPKKYAEKRMDQIKKDLDKTTFSWNGATKKGSDISYSIFGPTVAIEFACQGRGGNPNEHLHSMYRDPTNEYGGQLKKK